MEERRPGPRPRRLYARIAQCDSPPLEAPARGSVRRCMEQLNRVGRLVAAGSITHPHGHLVIVRASRLDEAARILRSDPWRGIEGVRYEIVEWDPDLFAGGVNLEPAPALGSGRLTALERVAVVVRDQAAAIVWYRDVLGLKVREEDPSTGFVEVSLGRGAAALSLVCPRRSGRAGTMPRPAPGSARRPAWCSGPTVSPPSSSGLRHARGTITEGRRPQPWGGETLRFCDPDGNEFLAFQSGSPGPPMRTARPRPTRRARRPPGAPGAGGARGKITHLAPRPDEVPMPGILPGIHQVEGVDPSPDFTTHVYLVREPGGYTLIDTGLPGADAPSWPT